jgi:hypothetical protein
VVSLRLAPLLGGVLPSGGVLPPVAPLGCVVLPLVSVALESVLSSVVTVVVLRSEKIVSSFNSMSGWSLCFDTEHVSSRAEFGDQSYVQLTPQAARRLSLSLNLLVVAFYRLSKSVP